MYKRFCDICGKEIQPNDHTTKFKLKQEWKSWGESGWERLDVHCECWLELCKIIKNKRDSENE